MRFIADLHIHSRFSRATSKDLDPEHLALWGRKKGISVIGSGDFTHPGWMGVLGERLVEEEPGLYRLRPDLEREIEPLLPSSCPGPTRFLLSGEISCIYKKENKTRKVHHLILMPDMESVEGLNRRLERIGNLSSDGRPILGLDSRDLLEITLEVNEQAFFIPAHIWTPWFSVFGSKSGFDTLEECFDDLTDHIHALETGLSSDPPMNRLLSSLDDYLLVSNSDAHSPGKLGREANLFETELDYYHMVGAMTGGEGFEGTIEFYPEESKYHLDGHRKCRVCTAPHQTREARGICPICGHPLTVGVLNRVHSLSDRETPRLFKPFLSLIPLPEILSQVLKCGPFTKKVSTQYERLLSELGPELHILTKEPISRISSAGGPLLAEAIARMRRNQVIREPGYDGQYGVIRLFEPMEKHVVVGQTSFFEPPENPESEPPPGKSAHKIPARGATPEVPSGEPFEPSPDQLPLDSAQEEAIRHQGGHLIISAGPGTGKTMTLTRRIAYLIRSGRAEPEEILALTFTNKAASEMRERIRALCGQTSWESMRVSTFHRFCLDILRENGEKLGLPQGLTICPEPDATILAERAVLDQGKGNQAASRFLRALPRIKAALALGNTLLPAYQDLLPVFERYQQSMRDLGMLDLDDLEIETLRLFSNHPEVCNLYGEQFSKIFVDEYQDTSPAQAAILKGLAGAGGAEVCAIGDPDQAIYGFRGADRENFLRFCEDFPGAREIRLSTNYRSSPNILSVSASLMEKEAPLDGKGEPGPLIRLASCRTHAEEAEMVVEQIEKLLGGTTYFSLDSGRVSSREEAEDLSFGDIAVLFRLNRQGDAFEEAFSRSGIPYVRSGEKPLVARYPVTLIWRFLKALQHPEVPFYVDAYLDLLGEKSPEGQEYLKRIQPGHSLGELIDQAVDLHGLEQLSSEGRKALRRFREIAEDFGRDIDSFLDSWALDRGIDHSTLSGDRVALMTLHAAKGLEWPVVFITGCEQGIIPCKVFGERNEEEERRLLYVGITRAQRILFLSHANHRALNGRTLVSPTSPFLQLIPDSLLTFPERSPWKRKKRPPKQLELF